MKLRSGFLAFLGFAGSLVLVARLHADPIPTFHLDGETWIYAKGERTFTGYLLKPEGEGPFPAVIINHGKGGGPEGFSMAWAREMVQWGLVCIAPTLTHAAGTDIQGKDGSSEENISRGGDCLIMLEKLGYVDLKRVAVAGHSMGGYVTIGFCGIVGARVKAAAVVAAGVAPRSGTPAPPADLAALSSAPLLMLHGTLDRTAAPAMSAALQKVLEDRRVPTRRELFVGTDHDLATNPATRAVTLSLIREWFTTHGILPRGKNTAPTLSPPVDQTIRAGGRVARLDFIVGDIETAAEALTVSVASSNPKVLRETDITLEGAGAQRLLVARPQANQAGPTTIFLSVSDGQLSTTRSFVLGFADATGKVPEPVVERRAAGREATHVAMTSPRQ